MVRAPRCAVLYLSLCNCSLEIDIPHRRELRVVNLALGMQVQERTLRNASTSVVYRGILLVPVDREAHASEELLVCNFVL